MTRLQRLLGSAVMGAMLAWPVLLETGLEDRGWGIAKRVWKTVPGESSNASQ